MTRYSRARGPVVRENASTRTEKKHGRPGKSARQPLSRSADHEGFSHATLVPASTRTRTTTHRGALLDVSLSLVFTPILQWPIYPTHLVSLLRHLPAKALESNNNSNLTWWHSTLKTIVSRGWLPNTSDRLILHADQTLLDSLRYEGVGKPLCLGTVIVSQFLCMAEM